MRQNEKIPATVKKQTCLHFWLYREILASFQSFQGLYFKTRQDFGNIWENRFRALGGQKIPELIGKNTFHLNVFASVEESISLGIKHLMLKIQYLTLYLCLFFCYKGYFSQRKNTFFSNGKINRVSPHNFKLTFPYVAILQSSSFEVYRVSRCYYCMESKN